MALGVTVREAMSIGGLAHCKVVAGKQGLDREIRHVTVMEVPDVVQWLKGYDMLVTSLYPIKDDPDALKNLVRQLHTKGSSALAIKTHRYVKEIPAEILEDANLLNFPVIEIDKETSYLDIMTPLISVIWDNSSPKQQDDFESLFQWITEIALSGKGLVAIAQALTTMLGNPVTLESEVPLNTKALSPDGIVPLKPRHMNELRKANRPLRMVRTLNGQDTACIVCPLILNKEVNAYITCWQTKKEFNKNDFGVMERVRPLFALEFLKYKTRNDVERKYRQEFLSDLLLGNINRVEEIADKAKIYNFDLTKDYQVIVLDADQFFAIVKKYEHNEVEIQEFKSSMAGEIENIVRRMKPQAIVSLWSDKIVVLYPVSDPDQADLKDRSVSFAKQLKKEIDSQVTEVTFTFGIGRFYRGMKGIHLSYKDAIQSIQLGKSVWGRNSIIHFDSLGVYRILSQCQNTPELNEIYRETVGKLAVYDEAHGSNLTETLTAYFLNNCSLTETAESMFIHVNTLKYRLEKVNQITGFSPQQSEGQFSLHLGLKIKSLLEVKF